MASTTVAGLMRDLELRKKNSEEACLGILKMYNPDKQFGFVRLDGGTKDVHFHLTTLLKSGFLLTDLALGARVSVIVWQIQDAGPQVKRFLKIDKPAPKPHPNGNGHAAPIAALPPPPPPPAPAPVPAPVPVPVLKDEWGNKRHKNRYPGGIEKLIIDRLRERKTATREYLSDELAKIGYHRSSLLSALSRVHARGWFIENGGVIYFREGT